VHSDFVAAATRGAMAVIDGNVMAINPGEEAKMQMFIWNNIFFSLGFDVRDHYKELGGDAAAFIAPVSDSEFFWLTFLIRTNKFTVSCMCLLSDDV
jgi:protein TIF31